MRPHLTKLNAAASAVQEACEGFTDALHGFYDEGDSYALLRWDDELRRTLDKYRDLASRVKGSGLNACESCGTDTRNPCRTVRVSRSAGGVQTNHMEIRCDNCSPRKS